VAVAVAALVGTSGCSGQGGAAPRNEVVESVEPTVGATSTIPDAGSTVSIGTQPALVDELPTVTTPTPTSLVIEDIDVAAAVTPVGVEDDGDMEVPAADRAGWYRFGPSPGAAGSAVLAAHVDDDGREGAFFRLGELRPGATVVVGHDDGSTQRFEVTETLQVAKADLASSGVFDRAGPARLALITCGGDFDREARSYRDNVVVLAVPEG